MTEKILLTGSNGIVGSRLYKAYPDMIPSPSLRNTSEDDLKRIIEESNAEIIIHTAAISDIGTCEADPEASYRANVLLPVALAKAAQGRKLICFSSDQVYSGSAEEGPYTEGMVSPANTYAKHKLEMENRVLDISPDAVMLRAEWMYDYKTKRSNYLMNVLGGQRAFSSQQYRGITYLGEVADAMEAVIHLPGGSYNFGSETTQSMYEITQQLLFLLHEKEEAADAPPRHNLWMNCRKAARYGVNFSDVMGGLRKCLDDHKVSASI